MSHLFRIPSILVLVLCANAAPFARAGGAPATRPAGAEADAKLDACTAQLQEIGRALAAYERDRHRLPDQLSDLFPDYVKDKKLFHCPADPTEGTPGRAF